MKRVPQGRYTKEFRAEAVKLVIEQGLSVPEASRRPDIPKSTISNWVRASKSGKLESYSQIWCLKKTYSNDSPVGFTFI